VLPVYRVNRRLALRRADNAHVLNVQLVHPVHKARMVHQEILDRVEMMVCPEILVVMVHLVIRDRLAMLDRMVTEI
jgi:hypothetical protein